MGYETRYSMQVTAYEKVGEKEVTLGQLIESAENKEISQTELIKYLKVLQDNPSQTKFKVEMNADEIYSKLYKENEEVRYAMDKRGNTSEPCKWYEHDKDMKEFSKKYPEYLFTLKGEGEEAGDMWVKYFLNGKVQTANAKITFDPFDVNSLK